MLWGNSVIGKGQEKVFSKWWCAVCLEDMMFFLSFLFNGSKKVGIGVSSMFWVVIFVLFLCHGG